MAVIWKLIWYYVRTYPRTGWVVSIAGGRNPSITGEDPPPGVDVDHRPSKIKSETRPSDWALRISESVSQSVSESVSQ